jgi:hypothetical protein
MYKTKREIKLASGVDLIKWERQRQIEEEGFDAEHDNDNFHESGELALAAVALAAPVPIFTKISTYEDESEIVFADVWPEEWSSEYDKRKRNSNGFLIPQKRSRKEVIRDLTKAGALIAAEIDRLLRIK